MRQEERDVYIIPPNFIEGGTLMGGMFKTRNVIEAGILGALTGVPVLKLPFSLTTRIIVLCLTTLPLVLVALIGIGGGSLSEFILQFFSFLRNRRTLDRDSTGSGKKNLHPSWGRNTPKEDDEETLKSRNRLEVDVKSRKIDQFKTFLAPEVKPLNPLADYVPVENIKLFF